MIVALSEEAVQSGFMKTLQCSNHILEAFGAENHFPFPLLLGWVKAVSPNISCFHHASRDQPEKRKGLCFRRNEWKGELSRHYGLTWLESGYKL